MRLWLAALLALGLAPAQAQAQPAPLAELRVAFGPDCTGVGVAVHLGGGIFLTAGHLLDPGLARREGCPGATLEAERPPTLIIDGRPLPGTDHGRAPPRRPSPKSAPGTGHRMRLCAPVAWTDLFAYGTR